MTRSALHEAAEDLRDETREMHRAIVSLIEELEAIDWYAQRIDATRDPSLRDVLAHSLGEEKEHASMTLEWIRRRDPEFDALLRRLLFQADGSIVHAEADAPDAGTRAGRGSVPGASSTTTGDRGLGIGSLRANNEAGGGADMAGDTARSDPGGSERQKEGSE
ncbi:MAG: ferritin [Myxococcota bacterium]